jgi:hypothetical protein
MPLRWLLHTVVLVAPVFVVMPFLLPARFADGLTDLSVGAWVVFSFVVPLVLGPVALHQGPSIIHDEATLVVPTTLGTRRLDLSSLARVWAREIPAKGSYIQLVGVRANDGMRVWFHWTGGSDTSERLVPLLRRAATRPGVSLSERAMRALELPEAPARRRRIALWLGGAWWYALYVGLFVGGIILDVHLLVDRAVGYEFAR